MSNTTVEPIKRLTPAGQGQSEKGWKLPDTDTRESWLSEARTVYHANKDRKAADGWAKTMHAAREISLIAAVDDANERTAYLAAKLAAAERTAEVLRDANRKLTGRLDAALLARDEARLNASTLLNERDLALGELREAQAKSQSLTSANGLLTIGMAQTLRERDAANDCIASLHRRAVAATEALGVVYGPADAE